VTSSSITTNTEGKSETKPTDVTPSVTHYCTIHFNALEIITPFLNSFTSSRETIGGTDSWRKMDAKMLPDIFAKLSKVETTLCCKHGKKPPEHPVSMKGRHTTGKPFFVN